MMNVVMQGISKAFGPVRVLEEVDFAIAGGKSMP
jgi:ribose transport system ATP-binding protein